MLHTVFTFDLASVINSLMTDSVSLQSEKNWNASVAASRVCFFFSTCTLDFNIE